MPDATQAIYADERPGGTELLALYASVGWTAYTSDPARLDRAIRGSAWVRTARVDGTLVGLCRAISDGETICYLQDVLVHPDHQRSGIGRCLVSDCLEAHRELRQLVLMTDDRPEQLAFYASLGLASIDALGSVRLNVFVRPPSRGE
ncbi:MAG: GNAT family N-acetyltransferase [Myxococcota bacterium]